MSNTKNNVKVKSTATEVKLKSIKSFTKAKLIDTVEALEQDVNAYKIKSDQLLAKLDKCAEKDLKNDQLVSTQSAAITKLKNNNRNLQNKVRKLTSECAASTDSLTKCKENCTKLTETTTELKAKHVKSVAELESKVTYLNEVIDRKDVYAEDLKKYYDTNLYFQTVYETDDIVDIIEAWYVYIKKEKMSFKPLWGVLIIVSIMILFSSIGMGALALLYNNTISSFIGVTLTSIVSLGVITGWSVYKIIKK